MRRAEMNRRTRSGRRPAQQLAGVCAICLVAVMAGWLAGCSTTGGGAETTATTLGAEQRVEADRLFDELRRQYSLHEDHRSLELANELLNGYPAYDRNDAALQMAIGSARRLGSFDRALRLVDLFTREFNDSPLVVEVRHEGVALALAAGDTADAVQRLVSLYDYSDDTAIRAQVGGELDGLVPSIDTDMRQDLFAANPRSELWTYLGYHYVAAALATGRPTEAETAVATMRSSGVDDPWLDAATELLAAGKPPPGYLVIGEPTVAADLLGVLCPTTGRFALLGNAFYDGAQLATERVNGKYGTQFRLQVEDTAADPVVAALAARHLCEAAGCIALIGALMSAPTASVAVAAEACGVPLISPTATNDRIWELGAGIFQTNQTEVFEARLLAQLTCAVLLKRKFVVIYPRTAEGERKLAVFTAAVQELGGEVIAAVAFAPETTDFSEQIETLKRAQPEVVYVPASVDQTILLGPQLDFYRAGALIIGPSAWNAPKLVEQIGAVMEGAVFPSDQAFFPTEWTTDFNDHWQQAQYPAEAAPLALRAYQATRFVLDTIVQHGVTGRRQLADALQVRFSSREIETEGPESLGRTARIIHAGEVVPFPAHLYTEAWQYTEAAADTLPRPDTDESAGADELDGDHESRR